jgi:hypothetical protein
MPKRAELMSSSGRVRKVVALLLDVLSGELSNPDEFLNRTAALPSDLSEFAAEAVHFAGHFISDQDIHARDSEWESRQRAWLENAVCLLVKED